MWHRTIAPNPRRCDELVLVRSFVVLPSDSHQVVIRPMRLLRTFQPLEALPIVGIAVALVRDLPTELYDELVNHPYEYRTLPHLQRAIVHRSWRRGGTHFQIPFGRSDC